MSTFGNTQVSKKNEFVRECRICLQTLSGSSSLYSLFEAWDPPWADMEATVADDLNKLTNIEVTKTDVLSKVICESCYDRLQSACYFVKLVQKNDQILKRSVHIEIDIPMKTGWPQPIRLDKNISSNIYDSTMEVEVKQEVISEEEDVGADARSSEMCLEGPEVKVEPEEITPQNPVLNRISMGTFPPGDHSTANESNGYINEEYLDCVKEEVSADDADLTLSDLPLDCQLCAKGFNSISGLKAHVIANHSYKTVKRRASGGASPAKRPRDDRHLCTTCRRTFATSTDLMVHETCHSLVACYVCKMSFDSFEQLTKHRPRCPAAKGKGKEAARLKTLEDVKRVQPAPSMIPPSIQTPLSCPSCHEQFSDAYYLSIHREIHHSTPNNELNDSSNNSELLANQSELSHAVNKVLERVSESLGMEDEESEASSSEPLAKQTQPSDPVNRVLERMRKSLGMVDDSVEASSHNEQLANENVTLDVVNSVLERVTASLENEDSCGEQLAILNEPSVNADRVEGQSGKSLETEKDKTGDPSSEQLVPNEPLDSVIERVSETLRMEQVKNEDTCIEQLASENASSDNENRVVELVGKALDTEEEIIKDSCSNLVSNKKSDIEKNALKEVIESLAMEEDEIEAKSAIKVDINVNEGTKSVNSELGSEHDGTEIVKRDLDSVNDVMEIETETTECKNMIIENIFTASASLLGLSTTEESVNTNLEVVNEDAEVKKLLDSATQDHFVTLSDFPQAVQSEADYEIDRGHVFEHSIDKLIENQVQGMEIDNMETVNQTLDGEISADNLQEGLEQANVTLEIEGGIVTADILKECLEQANVSLEIEGEMVTADNLKESLEQANVSLEIEGDVITADNLKEV